MPPYIRGHFLWESASIMLYPSRLSILLSALFFLSAASQARAQCFRCQDAPPGTIWCDDFEDSAPLSAKYFEYDSNGGDCIVMDGVGRDSSKGIRIRWQKGEVSAGGVKKSFGRTPDSYIGKYAVEASQTFMEIYWRMDVRSQPGWTGAGPDKLCRALCMANSNWATGAMAHLWSGGKNNLYLGMDPASGIGTDGTLKTTKYNDFNNLRWLGFKAGNIDFFSTENSGRWFCVEGHVKLNTPGMSDGIFEFWINDTLQASSTNMNWHATWNSNPSNYGINAIFFENYWNAGSPVEQERYFDNLVISTQRIGCACANATTPVEEYPAQSARLSPNPATSLVRVYVPPFATHAEVSLYTLLGERLIARLLPSGENSIDISSLPRGVYALHVAAEGKILIREMLVIGE